VNALFVTPPADPKAVPWPGKRKNKQRLHLYGRALDAAHALGGLAQLNHPNQHFIMDAKLLVKLAARGALLIEIHNQAFASWNRGKGRKPSTEELWDAALTAGATVWGVASDDAHHYHDKGPFKADRGWIMVRAARDAASIRAAMERGDFYSSTGVTLAELVVDGGELRVATEGDGVHRFTFIGRKGKVLARAKGTSASFPLARARGGYVRVVVSDARGKQHAWTQPFRVPR
jgi:hypothetical protein